MKSLQITNSIKKNYNHFIMAFFITVLSTLNLSAQQEIEVKGNISELGSDFLVVKNLKFFVDQNTDYRDRNNNSFSFSILQVGELVEVKGYSKGDRTYLADRVKQEDDSSGEHESEFEVKGHVTSLGENSIELNSYTFLINASTNFEGRSNTTFTFDKIKVGDFIEIKSYKSSNGDLVAVRVKFEDDNLHEHEVELTGRIDNILTNSVILGKWEFIINDQTIIMNRNKSLISFSDLNANDLVEVKAYKQFDGSFLAVRIKFEDHSDSTMNNSGETELKAQIESINGSQITVRGITFNTDTNTVFLDNNRIPTSFSALSVGMLVEIKGYRKSDGNYYASKIKIEDFFNSEIELKGKVEEIAETYIIVNGVKYLVTNTVVVLDHLNNPIEYSSLSVGQLIEIKGYNLNGVDLTAVRIKIEGNEDIELYGNISSINTTYFELNGLVINVDDLTAFLNHRNESISYSDFQVGYFVEVKYVINSDGSAKALRVKIEDQPGFLKVAGSIGSINSSSIQVEFSDFQITTSTIFIDKNFTVISANSLNFGDAVNVWVDATDASNRILLQVQSSTTSPTSVNEEREIVNQFTLNQNYPNPFNPSTMISFSLQNNQFVTLKIYNAIGQEVKTLISENMSAGLHNVSFNATDLTSGVYFYRLESGNSVSVKKMLLMK